MTVITITITTITQGHTKNHHKSTRRGPTHDWVARLGRRERNRPTPAARPHRYHRSADFPYYTHRRFAPPGSIPASSRLGDNIAVVPLSPSLPLSLSLSHTLSPPPSPPLAFREARRTACIADYEARNGTKYHERRRLTNAGERSGRKGDGGGGDGDGRSDTVVVVGSRYADTFAGCERPGQRRVNWRGVPSRDSHHDRRIAEGVFSCVYRYSVPIPRFPPEAVRSKSHGRPLRVVWIRYSISHVCTPARVSLGRACASEWWHSGARSFSIQDHRVLMPLAGRSIDRSLFDNRARPLRDIQNDPSCFRWLDLFEIWIEFTTACVRPLRRARFYDRFTWIYAYHFPSRQL
jgi:hypothetical protein